MDFGFEYPEVFSRAFKKQFGVSPKSYRIERPKVDIVEKALVISRYFVNYAGGLSLKALYIYLESLLLEGVSVDVDFNNFAFESVIKKTCERFLTESEYWDYLAHGKFYIIYFVERDAYSRHARTAFIFTKCWEYAQSALPKNQLYVSNYPVT